MTELELGRLGVALGPEAGGSLSDLVAEVEDLGYSAIWLPGPHFQQSLDRIGEVVRATRQIKVASGIIAVDRHGADAVAATYADLEESHPGRFVVGLGGAHGPQPLPTLTAFLDRLDTAEPTVPKSVRVLAAIGPRMLELARDRTAGAYPYLITPDYTAQARSLLGDDTALVVLQSVILEPDPERARQIARGSLGFLSKVGGYATSFRRMGFSAEEIAGLSDRLVDAVTAWGDADAIAARVREQQQAGADHVVLSIGGGPSDPVPVEQVRQLAKALIA
jgi:probable F420-dependent oxidoreductase